MYALTIAFGQPAVIWQLMFKTKEAADKAFETSALANDKNIVATIADDFGQIAQVRVADITGRMLEDMTESAQAHIARALHQQRMQAQAQKAAESDPQIRAAMRGPAVLSPVPQFNGR